MSKEVKRYKNRNRKLEEIVDELKQQLLSTQDKVQVLYKELNNANKENWVVNHEDTDR